MALSVLVEREVIPRHLDENDLPWLRVLFEKRYGADYDPETAEAWFKNCVLKSPMLFQPIRSDNAFCITIINVMPWRPNTFEAQVVVACAEDGFMWELLGLLRMSIEWSKRRKCENWRITSETEYDLGPLALRLGAKEQHKRYIMRF